jgi:hypothetical protein
MNTQPSANRSSSPHDDRIDAALARFARATPPAGLESRVAARLSRERQANGRSRSFRSEGSVRFLILRRLSIGAMATAAAGAIVFGTLEHSHRNLPPVANRAVQSGGAVPAGAGHTPTHALPQSSEINPQAPRTPAHGRAEISPNHPRHAPGSAVPRSPYPPESQPASSDQQQ